MLRVSLSLLPLLLSLQLITACGGDFETVKVKDYRLAVLTEDYDVKREFETLISEFNSYSEMTVLHYEEDPAQANSAIIITEGLENRDGKVGWGQWLSESEEESRLLQTPGNTPKRTVTYSMRLEFDAEYIRSRMHLTTAKATFEKQKLFFHEVGHGLEMDHHPNAKDIMFYDISGNKTFGNFFNRVRTYMSDRDD